MAGRQRLAIAAGLATATAAAAVAPIAGRRLVARTERRLCATPAPIARRPSPAAVDLHAGLDVVDLHADSLLWGRDLLVRGDRGQVDVPRLIEGRVALEGFAACVRVPRHLDPERNDDTSDDVLLVAIGGGWPVRTWRSALARAVYLARRAMAFADASAGRLTMIRTPGDLADHLDRRRAGVAVTAALLTIEGPAPLEGQVGNVDRLVDAGFRMLGLAHFVDNAFAGSAHGIRRGGLTSVGRELLVALEDRSVIVDVAHASTATIDDVLALARRPVVLSHGGLRSASPSTRTIPDEQARGIAATGGLIGVGFWPEVTGGHDVAAIARSIVRAIEVAGPDRVALGSDWDGGVEVPIDPTGLVHLTDALLAGGVDAATIRAVMGGNALRFLGTVLPSA